MTARLTRHFRKPAPGTTRHEVGICLSATNGGPVVASSGRILGSRMSIELLPRNGIWLSDLAYTDASEIECIPGRWHVHADGWLGLTWRQILAEWGMTPPLSDLEPKTLSNLAARVVGLGMSAGNRMENWSADMAREDDRSMLFRPSFSAGLRDLVWPLLRPLQLRQWQLHEMTGDMHMFGIGTPADPVPGRGLVVTMVRPRFGNALAMSRQPVPLTGQWQQVELPNTRSVICDRLIGELDGLGRPIILVGAFRPYLLELPAWVRGWLACHSSTYGRNCFALNEVRRMRRHGEFVLRDAYAGPGWQLAADETLLGGFMRALVRICGSITVARNSWSAGLAAENFLAALASRPATILASMSMQTVWLAMLDRVAAIPAIDAVERCGARLIEARGSMIRAQAGNEPATIRKLVGALWRLGYVPSGPELPDNVDAVCDPARYGGGSQYRPMATAMQRGKFGYGLDFDQLVDARPRRRKSAEHALLADLEALCS